MSGLTRRADELIVAFEDNGLNIRHFLDLQTGEVVSLFEDAMYEDEDERERIDAEPHRYLFIEPVPSSVGYEIMGDFVETLPEGKVRRELARALRKSRPFRRFKDALLNYPSVRED